MSAEEFLVMLKGYPSVNEAARVKLENIRKTSNYCQIVHVLLARSLQDSQATNAQAAISRAAVITSDRTLLRSLMSINAAEFASIREPEPVVPSLEVEESKPIPVPAGPNTGITNNTPEPVEQEEKKEQPELESRVDQIVESTVVFAEVSQTEISESTKIVNEKQAEIHLQNEGIEAAQVLENLAQLQSKKEKFRSLAEEVAEYLQQTQQDKPGISNTDNLADEEFIREVKFSEKSFNPETNRKTEQSEIIDQFIQKRLEPIKPEKGSPKQDLSAGSESYSENVISETLVEILLRQGKKEKAIEVLRKLIWKFPQKKALFAARIQELSK